MMWSERFSDNLTFQAVVFTGVGRFLLSFIYYYLTISLNENVHFIDSENCPCLLESNCVIGAQTKRTYAGEKACDNKMTFEMWQAEFPNNEVRHSYSSEKQAYIRAIPQTWHWRKLFYD